MDQTLPSELTTGELKPAFAILGGADRSAAHRGPPRWVWAVLAFLGAARWLPWVDPEDKREVRPLVASDLTTNLLGQHLLGEAKAFITTNESHHRNMINPEAFEQLFDNRVTVTLLVTRSKVTPIANGHCSFFSAKNPVDPWGTRLVEQWPLPTPKLVQLKILVQQQLEMGHGRPSSSPWNSPVFGIKTANGSQRLLQDLRKVNERMVPFGTPQRGLPWIPTLVIQEGGLYPSFIDLEASGRERPPAQNLSAPPDSPHVAPPIWQR